MTAFSTIEAASVTISHDDALRALTNASKAIDKKAEVEILYAAVVRSAPGGIAISATSLDLTSTTFIRCQAPKGFLAVFDCQTGLNLLKKAKKSDEVTFTMLEHGCQVSIGKLNVKLNEVANRDEELPSINDTEIRQLNQYFTIPSAQLLKIIEKVSFAISTEESRYYLNGIYMCPTTDGETSGMDFVATDGHRLSRFSIELPEGAEGLEIGFELVPADDQLHPPHGLGLVGGVPDHVLALVGLAEVAHALEVFGVEVVQAVRVELREHLRTHDVAQFLRRHAPSTQWSTTSAPSSRNRYRIE